MRPLKLRHWVVGNCGAVFILTLGLSQVHAQSRRGLEALTVSGRAFSTLATIQNLNSTLLLLFRFGIALNSQGQTALQ